MKQKGKAFDHLLWSLFLYRMRCRLIALRYGVWCKQDKLYEAVQFSVQSPNKQQQRETQLDRQRVEGFGSHKH